MNKSNVSFYGYNDGKAMTIYTRIMLFVPTIISFCLSIILSIVAIGVNNYYLLLIWILPGILLLTYLLNYILTNYNDKVFLSGAKKKHSFYFKNGMLIKDEKEIKNKHFKVFKFKKYLFLEFKRSYYRIPNDEFVNISRDEFLLKLKINKLTHKAKFIEKYKCPCCGYYTLDSKGLYDICPVCFWEDEEVEDHNEYNQCNRVSLSEARQNYLKFGSCTKDMRRYVRRPKSYEKVEKHQILTLSKFQNEFIKIYASDVPIDKLKKYVIGKGNYIWHLFSWDLIEQNKYLTGEKAKEAYDKCNKDNAIIYEECPEETFSKIDKRYMCSKDIAGCGEIYVFAEDMSWVYINTHEESLNLGPYFICINNKGNE